VGGEDVKITWATRNELLKLLRNVRPGRSRSCSTSTIASEEGYQVWTQPVGYQVVYVWPSEVVEDAPAVQVGRGTCALVGVAPENVRAAAAMAMRASRRILTPFPR
jgi:hypothetical protein